MEPRDCNSSFPRLSGPSHGLLLTHDVFFGELKSSQSMDGITLSHRIAACPPEEVTVHTHLEAHFVLITGGRYVSSARAVPDPGTTLIYNPPGTTHRDHFEQGKGSFFTISIPNKRLSETADAELLSEATYLHDHHACGLAREIFIECGRWDACSPLKVESLYSELVAAASRHLIADDRLPRSWLRVAYEMIQDGYKEGIGICQVARYVGIHPTHLARAFRAFFGCTPGDLLRARRLEKATELLLNSNHSLAQVALDCGFSDQAQFTKAFRRFYGTTPGGYRRLSASRTSHVAF